jgi:hypothetical protein
MKVKDRWGINHALTRRTCHNEKFAWKSSAHFYDFENVFCALFPCFLNIFLNIFCVLMAIAGALKITRWWRRRWWKQVLHKFFETKILRQRMEDNNKWMSYCSLKNAHSTSQSIDRSCVCPLNVSRQTNFCVENPQIKRLLLLYSIIHVIHE